MLFMFFHLLREEGDEVNEIPHRYVYWDLNHFVCIVV